MGAILGVFPHNFEALKSLQEQQTNKQQILYVLPNIVKQIVQKHSHKNHSEENAESIGLFKVKMLEFDVMVKIAIELGAEKDIAERDLKEVFAFVKHIEDLASQVKTIPGLRGV